MTLVNIEPERAHMGSVIVRLGEHGQFFATRERAREICALIDAMPQRESVIIDWSGVEAITGAFASEYVGWFMRTSRRVGDQGMNDETRATCETAVRRLGEAKDGGMR